MNRAELKQYIIDNYCVEAEQPWMEYPGNEVFRHTNNRKWFVLIMDVSREKLGLKGTDVISVVNLKCDPIMTGSLRTESGFFPAYHMNKDKWISIALDGSVDDAQIKALLELSYNLTNVKTVKK